MDDRQQVKSHNVIMNSRKSAKVSGVRDVRSFDEQEIVLETELGILMIRGGELHIDRLTLETGEVDINGRLDSLVYSELKGRTKSGDSILGRMFK